MIQIVLPVTQKMINSEFFDFIKDGVADLLKDFFHSKSGLDIKILRDGLSRLSQRYDTKLTANRYLKVLISSIEVKMHGDSLLIWLSPKSKFYKIIKSIELGSYQVVAMPLLGQVLAMMPSLLDRLFTDYEIVKEKLNYYQI